MGPQATQGGGPVERMLRYAGPLAALAFVLAVAGFGLALPGFEQARHPVALLGARGIPHADAFNLLGFVLGGTLAAMCVGGMLRQPPAGAGWPLRIGGQLLLLAGLAFAGMGVFPLDPSDLDNRVSQRHATAWLLWTVAFVPGALLLGAGLWSRPAARGLAWLSLAAALLVALLAFGPANLLPQALAQRVAFLAWLVWLGVGALLWPRATAR